MKRLTILGALLLSLVGLAAKAAPSDEPSLTVNLSDGTTMEFKLSERPQMLWEGGYVHFTTASSTVAVEQERFRGFQFSGTAGIRTLQTTEGRISYGADGTIRIDGITSVNSVEVFDAAGRQLRQTGVTTDGRGAVVNLSSMPAGVYVIKVNKKSSYKVVRP